uniref:Zinc carboxypeptidase A 1 n=1 Tax=Plectus sambesii TaxID=2011161 RepID=A0A914X2L1_9BILA
MKSGLILGAVAFLYVARFGHCSDDKETKRPYKVFRFVPENLEALQFADRLYRSAADYKLDFWKSPKGVGIFVDVMVPPQYVDTFPTLLTQNNISYIVTIPDVAKLIEEREKPAEPDTSTKFIDILTSFFRSRKQDDRSTKALFNFGDYSTYPKITYWLQTIAFNYPSFTKTFKIGTTTEGRAIEGIKIGNPASSRDKKAVWIDGGIHAREWAAVHTALYIINELVSKYGYDPVVTHYVDSLNFYIVPCLNPDGYEYSRSDSSVPERRMWRKNRAKEKCGKDIWGRKACCGGVDLNRNFGFHWAESGSSDDPCSEVYQGTKEFSEPESRALRDMLLSPELNGKTDAYISFHTYAQMWMFPFGHQRNQVPDDVNDLRTVGREAVNALQSVFGTRYQLGTGADMLYPSSGGSDDWAKEKAKIKYTYLLELRPEESAYDGFLLEKSQLIPTGKETWAGVKKVIDAVLKKNHLEQNNRDSNNGGAGFLCRTIAAASNNYNDTENNQEMDDTVLDNKALDSKAFDNAMGTKMDHNKIEGNVAIAKI